MGKNLEIQTQNEYDFYVNTQPWNKDLKYLELWAAFAKPELVGRAATKRKGWFRRKILRVDATEGRYDKIIPIFKKYEVRAVSGGFEPMCIRMLAESRAHAEQKLEEMFEEIKNVCGPKYPIKLEIHEISISIKPLKNG